MRQAIASIGQIHLAEEFQKIFQKNKFKVGQILISPDDTEQRRRALNVRRTFDNLFKLKAIPIVNENDTTATSEIKYGDNDRLAARVAQIIDIIIFSDVDGSYDKGNKKIIKEVKNSIIIFLIWLTQKLTATVQGYGYKIEAAGICMNAGCHMFIGNGNRKNPIKYMIEKKILPKFVPKYRRWLQEKMDCKFIKFTWNNIHR